ncbi:MAG TPA: hypothetical protein VEQ63_14965, partial [Bryobacteraceae bacterium]|nr:hypothetical protein [Bryobacteraceae bacterium]
MTSSSSFGCGSLSVTLGSTVPGDALIGNQTDADCFAWAQFVALNWPTVTSSFGAPGDLTPVQWQTYMQQESLYPPNGQAPPVWGAQSQAPTGCATDGNLRSHRGMRVLSTKGKFGSTPKGIGAFLPPEIQEAAPATGPAWLGAQNGTNVWFEVVLNKDIYNFVTDPSHQFYNATKQQSWVNNGQGQPIVFPKGTLSGSPVGAVELKAAWMEVPGYNPAQPGKWAKYKLSPAVVVGPSNSQCRVTTVALVGLHIIHKTGSQPTWVWSTFEHVDNVPGPNQTAECCNFNSSTCKPQQVTVSQASCLGP